MRLSFERLVAATGIALLLSSCATDQKPSFSSLSSPTIAIRQTSRSADSLDASTSETQRPIPQGNEGDGENESSSETLDSTAVSEFQKLEDKFATDSLILDEEEIDDTSDETIAFQPPTQTPNVSSTENTIPNISIVTVIPSFTIGDSSWRHVVKEFQPGEDRTKPYIVRLERQQGSSWTPVLLVQEPRTGGMQTSLPIKVGKDLFAFVSIDDGTNAEVFLMKSSDDGREWSRHGTVEKPLPDKWPNAVNQYAIVCKDWVINIDSEGSMTSKDGGLTWTDNGGYFQYRGTTPDEVVLACGEPRATRATLPTPPDQAKK